MFIGNSLGAFSTLPEAQKWAAGTQEWPDPDQYEKIYTSSYGWSLMRMLGISKPEHSFFDLLKTVTVSRVQKGYQGRHAVTLRLGSESHLIILSNIQGAFHSLVRILTELHQRNILSSDFKIKNNHFLILNGNTIGDSPYNIQVLHLMLILMKNNPQQLFSIRGVHEDKEYWVDNDLGKELSFLYSPFDVQRKSMRDFFNTLPLGIYIFGDDRKEKPLRISYFGPQHDEFNHLICEGIPHENGVAGLCTVGTFCSYPQGPLSGFIVGDDKHIIWDSMKGLEWNKKQSAWYIVSSPARLYRQQHRFFYDAFAQVDIGNTLSLSTISLYNSKKGTRKFRLDGSFNLISAL